MKHWTVWVTASLPVGQYVHVQAASKEQARALAEEEALASDQDDWMPNGDAFDIEATEVVEEQPL